MKKRPKPVLLAGENGSGKGILLSHIVNAMINAKDTVYQESGEIDSGKVFKLRSNTYMPTAAEYYFARVDSESGLLQETGAWNNSKKFGNTLPRFRKQPRDL